jgi:dihydroorotase
MTWDLLLAGGEPFDVAVAGGVIAATGTDLAHADARTVVDVSGLLVTPGLIDLHTHVGPGYWGIEPDPIAWYTGVTTWVDAGTTGAYTFETLRRQQTEVRVAPLLNISAIGLAGRTGESRDLANCDVPLAIDTVQRHRDLIRGVKVRIDRETVGGNGVEPLKRALQTGEACHVPVMVHIGSAPPAVDEVLGLLRPGDIVTHCSSGIASPLGPALVEAVERGVLMDIGHGSGGFAFDILERQLDLGVRPTTISTDLHARSLHGPAFDLPATMMKLLAAGLPLTEVLEAVTLRPAQALDLPGGALVPGAPADLAVFEVRPGDFEVTDAHLRTKRSPLRLVNVATYTNGRLLPPKLPPPAAPWIPLTDAQRAALARRDRDVRALLSTPLVGAEDLEDQFPRSR